VQPSYSQITALCVQYGANRSATLLTPYPTGVWRLLISVTPSNITERGLTGPDHARTRDSIGAKKAP